MSGTPPKDDHGGDSSRESGFGDPHEEEQVVEEAEAKEEISFEDDCGCGPGGEGGDGQEEEEEGTKDVKKMTGFDKNASQHRRRQETLNWQRQRRDEIMDKIRQLEDSAFSDSETEDEMDFVANVRRQHGPPPADGDCFRLEEINEEEGDIPQEEMEVQAPTKSKKKRQRNKNSSRQGNQAMDVTPPEGYRPQSQRHHQQRRQRQVPCRPMLSEWMLEKPEDFEENWLGVVVPSGKRVIVLASRGKTKIFSRKDEYLGCYRSQLPGGCRYNYRDSQTNRNRGVTILDCIWSRQTQAFYVLDLLCWNSHSCVNCETDYRQFFLTSKFSENLELFNRSAANPFPFKPLPYFPAAESQLHLWSTVHFPEPIDGLLFFHKQAFYISQTNPLCLWLVLPQTEAVLGISVSPDLLQRQVTVKNLKSRRRQQHKTNQEKRAVEGVN